MNIIEMNKIILEEQLDGYAKFYPQTIYHGEDCLSYKKTGENLFEVLAMGERGKVAFHYENISEQEACDIILAYLRDSKFLVERMNARKKKYM